MAKAKTQVKKDVKEVKQPRTIKVSTVIIAVVILLALIGSFISGIYVSNHYNSQVKAQATELAKELKANE